MDPLLEHPAAMLGLALELPAEIWGGLTCSPEPESRQWPPPFSCHVSAPVPPTLCTRSRSLADAAVWGCESIRGLPPLHSMQPPSPVMHARMEGKK
eukprot:1156866-Pelagomonas_calceolata.AAC.2